VHEGHNDMVTSHLDLVESSRNDGGTPPGQLVISEKGPS
jgi:hypothetical protein